MNTADIYDGMMRNMEFQARNDARLDAIYDREYKRQTNQMNCNNQDTARLNAIESRLTDIENRLNKLQDMIVSDQNNLFVFAPKQNVNTGISFTLTEAQFNDLVNRIVK